MKQFFNYILLFTTSQLFIVDGISALENASCDVAKCNGSILSRSYSTTYTRKRCRCDADCGQYKDCCVDSSNRRTFSPGSLNNFDCVTIQSRPYAVYMKRNCRKIGVERRKCRSSQNFDELTANYTLKLPVTTSDGITYGNQFCASCNGATNYTAWGITFLCNGSLTNLNTSSSDFSSKMSKFIFNDTLGFWTFVDGNETEYCQFHTSPGWKLRKSLRICVPDLVKSCPLTALGVVYRNQCINYTSLVQSKSGVYYKNEYCALCNNIPSDQLDCSRTTNSTTSTFRPTSVLFDTSTRSTTTTSSTTRRPSTTQRSSTEPISNITPRTSTKSPSIENSTTTQIREFLQIIVKQKCKDVVDSLLLMKLTVETKSFPTMKRTLLKGSDLISAYPVRICKTPEDHQKSEAIPEESYVLKYIVNLGVIISIFFTLSHLYDFLFSNTSSNQTQRIFASYVFTLVIGNVGFLASNLTAGSCSQLGSITYFGYLTSFFWLSSLSFDISCKMWCCIQETDLFNQNPSSKKFTTYSFVSWIFPLIVTLITTYIAEREDDFISEGHTYETCWFQNNEKLLIFFLIPLTITMSVNAAFYLFSAHVVWYQRSTVVKLLEKHGIDFKIHTGLIITSNLMWLAALIAVYYDGSFLWLCFACLNVILGLLVYICSPVKHAFSNQIMAYFNQCFLPEDKIQIQKSNN